MRKSLIFLVITLLILVTGCDDNSTGNNKPPEPPYSPTPGHNETGVGNLTTLRWTCYDAEDDDLTYSVYLGKSNPVLVASGLTTNSYTPETLDYSTDYHWKVSASDGHSTTKGPEWKFRTVAEDIAPTDPSSPVPANNSTDLEVNQTLRWYCYDMNGDPITFDVKLGTTQDPPLIATGLTNYQFNVNNLEYHTQYYWQVIARSTDNVKEGPLWCFETRYYNYPPDKPNTPLPSQDETGVSIHENLFWQCDDYENDPLNYDVYFGVDNNPPILAQGHQHSTYEPGILEPNTDYYWRIDAWDGSNYSHGPVWHFQTGEPNTAPEVPSMPWPEDGATDESIFAMLRWTCSDPDGDDLVYKVYFSTTAELNDSHVIALGIDDETWELATLNYNTTYYWKVAAHDGELEVDSPVWSFTTEQR